MGLGSTADPSMPVSGTDAISGDSVRYAVI